MKNYTLLFIAGVFSFSSFAQQSDRDPANTKIENTLVLSDRMPTAGLAVKSYHVEETINMSFGGTKTTYDVPSLDLVNTNELGPTNTRVVIPKYVKVIPREELAVVEKLPDATVTPSTKPIAPVKVAMAVPDGKLMYASINILTTYERVLEKGYQNIDMLIAVGNYRFFAGDLVTAAKWYTQLFDLTTDLDAVYYYRYAQALNCIGQTEKAKEMMRLFESKK